MNPERAVRDFCAAIPRLDVKERAGFFSEDAVSHDIPLAAVQRTEASAATLNPLARPAG
jgi:limonene-1,2-epoxide hydrolase